MKFIQKVPSFTQILVFSYPSHLYMGLTCIEIKTEIWISFLRNGSMLLLQKCSAMAHLSEWG